MEQIPRAMLFDLDGTILDWQTGMEQHWREACENGCAQLDGLDVESLLPAIRSRRDWFWQDAERARIGRLDLDAASATIVRDALMDLDSEHDDAAEAIASDYRARPFSAF